MEINFWRTHHYFERTEVKYFDNSGPKKMVRRQTELAETNTHVGTFGMCFHLYSTEKEKSPSDQHYPPHGGILPQRLLMSTCSKKSETQQSYFQIYHCHKLPNLPDCSLRAKLFPHPLLSPIASSIAIYSKHVSGKCLSN